MTGAPLCTSSAPCRQMAPLLSPLSLTPKPSCRQGQGLGSCFSGRLNQGRYLLNRMTSCGRKSIVFAVEHQGLRWCRRGHLRQRGVGRGAVREADFTLLHFLWPASSAPLPFSFSSRYSQRIVCWGDATPTEPPRALPGVLALIPALFAAVTRAESGCPQKAPSGSEVMYLSSVLCAEGEKKVLFSVCEQ